MQLFRLYTCMQWSTFHKYPLNVPDKFWLDISFYEMETSPKTLSLFKIVIIVSCQKRCENKHNAIVLTNFWLHILGKGYIALF